MDDLFAEEKKEEEQKEAIQEKVEERTESDFILVKSVKCPVCDKNFKTKSIKNSKAMRLEPDEDLRPRYRHIDTLKYDVVSCPYCGYSALTRYFTHISPTQIKLIRTGVCENFQKESAKVEEVDNSPIDYQTAIDRHKLALFNTVVKKGKASEKAYECLKISWLYRGFIEEMEETLPEAEKSVEVAKKEEQAFYEQAFEGFQKAIGSELYPMCGMDQNTVDLLIAEMAYKLEKYDISSKYVAAIIGSNSVSTGIKRHAVDLKQELLKALKNRS